MAVEAVMVRRDRLEAHIEAVLPEWSIAPVVEALQALRGVRLVAAATLVAELGDITRFTNPRQLMAYSVWCHPGFPAAAGDARAALPRPVTVRRDAC